MSKADSPVLGVLLEGFLPEWLAREPENPFVAVCGPLVIQDDAELRDTRRNADGRPKGQGGMRRCGAQGWKRHLVRLMPASPQPGAVPRAVSPCLLLPQRPEDPEHKLAGVPVIGDTASHRTDLLDIQMPEALNRVQRLNAGPVDWRSRKIERPPRRSQRTDWR